MMLWKNLLGRTQHALTPLWQKIRGRRWWPRSIRWQMLAGVVLLETLSICLFMALLVYQQTRESRFRAEVRLMYEANSMAVQAREALQQEHPSWIGLSVTMMGDAPTVASAKITDPVGNVLFSSQGDPSQYPLTHEEREQIAQLSGDQSHVFSFGDHRTEAISAIYTGYDLRGYAWVEYNQTWEREETLALLRNTGLFALIWIASSAVLVLLLSRAISRPLKVLHMGTRKLMSTAHSAKDFPLPVAVHNELGELIEAFNRMVASLAEQRAGLNDTLSLLDSMLAHAPIGLAFFDRNSRFVRVNQVFASLTRLPLSRHLGRTLPELLPQPVAGQLESAIARVFNEQEAVRNLEVGGQTPEGRVWTWLVSAYPVLTTPHEARWVGVILLDTTDRKRGEEALRKAEKLAVTGRLAASIAHEINNPLEAVTNLLFLLRNYCQLDDAARNYVNMAEHEVRRVSEITQQTLRFYRQSTQPARVDVAELLDSVLSLYQGRFHTLQLNLDRRYDPSMELFCFSGEIRQIIANLVGNAIDASASGGNIVVHARRSRLWSDSKRSGIRFTVADNGCGMDEEVRSHAFDAFFTTKETTGTGLGLWVSLEIIQKHGGVIHMRSRAASPGRNAGTVFQFFIPDKAGKQGA
jgi:PAS domain S-box-containing protein